MEVLDIFSEGEEGNDILFIKLVLVKNMVAVIFQLWPKMNYGLILITLNIEMR